MMRKDVKVGFAVGGVLLAVLVVYMMVGSGGGNGPSGTGLGGAGIVTEENATANAPDRSGERLAARDTPADLSSSSSGTGGAGNVERLASANGSAGALPNSDPNKDLWDGVLNHGKIDSTTMIAVTQTPQGAAGELAGGSRDLNAAGTDPATPTAGSTPGSTPGNDAIVAPRANPIPGVDQPAAMEGPTTVPGNSAGDSAGARPTSDTPRTESSGVGLTKATTHVINKNETLMKIAQVAYGDARYYTAIKRANPNIDERKLKPGMTILLPPISEVRPDSSPSGAVQPAAGTSPGVAAPSVAAPVDPRTQYRVASGDTLEKIALRLYGKRAMIEKIYETNKAAIGPDPNRLKLNMLLTLPEPPTQTAGL